MAQDPAPFPVTLVLDSEGHFVLTAALEELASREEHAAADESHQSSRDWRLSLAARARRMLDEIEDALERS